MCKVLSEGVEKVKTPEKVGKNGIFFKPNSQGYACQWVRRLDIICSKEALGRYVNLFAET